MTTIDANESICTVIQVFTVTPANHQALFDLLQNATEEVISKMPGYISANLHLSDDVRVITNYAQWRSMDDFEHMLENEEARKHLREAVALAEKFEMHPCHIVWQHGLEHELVMADFR